MIKKYIFGLVCFIFIFSASASEREKFSTDRFVTFLHIRAYYPSPELQCPNMKGVFFSPRSASKISQTDPRFSAHEKLKALGVEAKDIYAISYARKNEEWIYRGELGAFSEDSPTQISFTMADKPLKINLQLVDPKMAVIKSGKLPKNSRYTRVKSDESDGYIFTAPGAVYLWENDSKDQKVLCNIVTELD